MEGGENNFFAGIIGFIPIIVKGISVLIDLITNKTKGKEIEEDEEKIQEEMRNQINELQIKKKQFEESTRKNEERIQELEQKLKESLDEIKRNELEKQKKLIEQEQEEKNKRIEELKQKEEDLKKCKDSLKQELSKGMYQIIKEFCDEEKKWLDNLEDPEIKNKINNLKNKLEILFNELFENEKIMEKINNKFIDGMKAVSDIKELSKMNFIIIGKSGVGKSTLTNEALGEMLAKEGMGTSITTCNTKYESKLVPFLTLLDTRGTENGSGHNLEDVLKDTLNYIDEKLNNNDPNEHIHCVLYCTTSNRFFKDELKVILKLREKYDGKKLPIVIVYTKATKDEEVESVKNSINEFLMENGESLSDDIFGIKFIKINAREDKEEILGKMVFYPSFGLANLMSNCFNRGEKAYRFAIKNSLIQISKNAILTYIDNVSTQLKDNQDFFSYLNQEFESNFSYYLAYIFEKITDVENQEGINQNEMESLHNYLKIEEKNKYDDLTKSLCMFCQKPVNDSFKCSFCEAVSCEPCFISQFEIKDKPRCINCDQEIIQNSENETKMESNNIEFEKNVKISKSINYINILRSNLNLESKNAINIYINEFKNELIDIIEIKFEKFIKVASEKLHTKILEKYIENLNYYENIKINEIRKDKDELKCKVIDKLNEILKGRAIENFLKKNSAELYKSIIEIFSNNLKSKIDEFINNLETNKEVSQFFKSCNALNEEKELKIKGEIDKYIKHLREKEEESGFKAVKIMYGDQLESQGESGNSETIGETGESKEIGDTKINSFSGN